MVRKILVDQRFVLFTSSHDKEVTIGEHNHKNQKLSAGPVTSLVSNLSILNRKINRKAGEVDDSSPRAGFSNFIVSLYPPLKIMVLLRNFFFLFLLPIFHSRGRVGFRFGTR